MADLPSGTVTFLFTDIEGSTELWERDRAAMAQAVERHLDVLRDVVEAHRGVLYKTVGDGTQSAFPAAGTALAAALEGQRRLIADTWPDPPGPLRVRMALHAGEAEPRKGDYLAAPLNRLARLLAVARGSQILLTEAVQQLVQDDVPPGASLAELGEITLRDLERPERIFALAHADLPSNVPHTRLGDDSTRHFPVSLTPFLGREDEIAGVVELLHMPDVRLVTLTGPGGTGKTRLAQEIGTRLAQEFTDGAVYVDLAPLREPALVLPEIAVMLGLLEAPGRRLSDVTQGYLANRGMLLVLDNFEHLLDAAPVVTDLLAAGSQVKALVTSRAPLRLRGEREYPVPTLRLPSLSDGSDLASLTVNEAVAFFLERARAVRPDFTLTAENAPAVADICRRLDGLPLALELAAARVKMLPLPVLLARLDARLPLLTGGARDAPERQRTLRDAIAWSHDLLSRDERRLFRRLGAFVGGWHLDAAEVVANLDGDLDALEGLASLGDKSLVRLDERGIESRYGMLETIREFAVEQLAVSDEEISVRDAHARHLLDFATQFDQGMFTAERREWQVRMEAEMPNLRAALNWLETRGDAEHLLILAARSFWSFWERGSVGDVREWSNRALALPGPVSPETRALALGTAALSAWNQGDNEPAEQLARAGLDLCNEEGFDLQAGLAFYVLMLATMERGNYADAAHFGDDAIRHFRRSGNTPWVSQALIDAGLGASLSGDDVRATALREEGLALCRDVGNVWGLGVSASDSGAEAENDGDVTTALRHYRGSLERLMDIRDEVYIAHPLAGMASMAVKAGQMELASRLLGVVQFLHEVRGTTAWIHERERDERTEALVRAALGEDRFDQEIAVGRRLSISEAVRQALDEVQEVGPE